jgi:hypothetical protein
VQGFLPASKHFEQKCCATVKSAAGDALNDCNDPRYSAQAALNDCNVSTCSAQNLDTSQLIDGGCAKLHPCYSLVEDGVVA